MKFKTKILIIDKVYKLLKTKIVSKYILKNMPIEKYFDDFLEDNYPSVVSKLQTCVKYSVALCATNGKRIMTNIFCQILKQNKKTFITNISNENNMEKMPVYLSIIKNMIESFKVFKKEIKKDYLLLALDENEAERYFNSIKFNCLLLNNLFIDQKDDLTYEDKKAKIKDALSLNSDAALIINADEPHFYEIDSINQHFSSDKRKKIFFGFDKIECYSLDFKDKNDLTLCPKCNCTLDFKERYYSHTGNYYCDCGFKRPKLDVRANAKIFKNYCLMEIFYKEEKYVFKLPFASIANAYDALGAISLALYLNFDIKTIEKAFKNYEGTSMVDERFELANKKIILKEIKNPVSLTQNLSYLYKNNNTKVVFVLDNKIQDGIDTAWIWDSNFDCMKDFENRIYITGQRLDDMALKIKYSNVNPTLIIMEESIKTALKCCFYELKENEDMLILTCPSKIKEIKDIIGKIGIQKKFAKN